MKIVSSALVLASLTAASLFGAADATLLGLLPAEAKVVGGIYAARTAASPFGKFLIEQIGDENKDFKRFILSTGFDPRLHLQEVLFASPTVGGNNKAGLVVARGTFNSAQIVAAAKAEGAKTTMYKGVEIVEPDANAGFAILDQGVAVLGSADLVRRAIDQRTTRTAIDAKLLARINQLSNEYDAWIVSSEFVNPLIRRSEPGTSQTPNLPISALGAIEQTSGGVRFGTVIEIDGEAVTKTEKDAQSLADVVKFITGILQMQKEKNPEAARFAALLENLQVRTEAATVKIRFTVDQKEVEKFVPKKVVKTAAAQ